MIAAYSSGKTSTVRVSSSADSMLASDSWALVRSGTYDAGVPLEVAQALANDTTSSVIQTVATPVAALDDIASAASKPAYRAWVVRTFKPALDRLGWTPKKGESDDAAELRGALVGLVAGIGHDGDGRARARSLMLRYLDSPASVDANTIDRAIGIAAADGDAALYDKVQAA